MDEGIIDSQWNKVARDSKKAGFREGVTDGRQTVFQTSFDEGFAQGFEIGFILGKYKGVLRDQKVPELEHTKRANCVLCKDLVLQKKSTQEIGIQQQISINSLLQKLHIKHSENSKIVLENKLV